MTADRILWIALRLAEHLDQPELILECLFRRSQVFAMQGEPEGSLQVLRRAAEVAEAAGLTFERGKCLTLTGDALHELGRDDEALAAWLASIEPLTQTEADSLLGPTHADIAQLYFDRGDEPEALAHWESAARSRIRVGQIDRALPLLYAVISRQVERGDPSLALPAVELLASDVKWKSLDSDIVTLVRRAAVDAIISAQPERQFYEGSVYGVYLDDEQASLARRWFEAAQAVHALAPSNAEEQAIMQLRRDVCRVAVARPRCRAGACDPGAAMVRGSRVLAAGDLGDHRPPPGRLHLRPARRGRRLGRAGLFCARNDGPGAGGGSYHPSELPAPHGRSAPRPHVPANGSGAVPHRRRPDRSSQ